MNVQGVNLMDLVSAYVDGTDARSFIMSFSGSGPKFTSSLDVGRAVGASDLEGFLIVASIAMTGGIISRPSAKDELWQAILPVLSNRTFVEYSKASGSHRFWQNLLGDEVEVVAPGRSLTHEQARRFIELDREFLRISKSQQIMMIHAWSHGDDLIEGVLTLEGYLEGVRDPEKFIDALVCDDGHKGVFEYMVRAFSDVVDLFDVIDMNVLVEEKGPDDQSSYLLSESALFRYRSWLSEGNSGALYFMRYTIGEFQHWREAAPDSKALNDMVAWIQSKNWRIPLLGKVTKNFVPLGYAGTLPSLDPEDLAPVSETPRLSGEKRREDPDEDTQTNR